MDAGQESLARNLGMLTVEQLTELEGIVAREKLRREREAKQYEQENLVSLSYHQQAPCERHNGVPVWVKPELPMMGYPSGMSVWHNGEGWQNNQDEVNHTEPGSEGHTWTSWVDAGAWVGDEPEEEPLAIEA